MTLALIAGSGNLPLQIIQSCLAKKKPLLIIGFEGQTLLSKDLISYSEFSLGSIGKILDHLRTNNIQEIVFAGGIRRPSWSELDLDWMGLKWFKSLGLKALKGDDDLLSGILDLLKQEGFKIIKPSDLLDDLVTQTGALTYVSPSDGDWMDIERGREVLDGYRSMSDVGQSVIVRQGMVLGVEAIEGTAALIQRCGVLKRSFDGAGLGDGSGYGGGSGCGAGSGDGNGVGYFSEGVLVKMPKTQQSLEIDLPTIGPNTIKQLKKAGFSGIALGAGNTQIIDYQETIKLANGFYLFIVGI
jgi:DUF1009 family protein